MTNANDAVDSDGNAIPFGKLYAAGIAHVHSHSSERRKSMIFRQSGIMILITLIT